MVPTKTGYLNLSLNLILRHRSYTRLTGSRGTALLINHELMPSINGTLQAYERAIGTKPNPIKRSQISHRQ